MSNYKTQTNHNQIEKAQIKNETKKPLTIRFTRETHRINKRDNLLGPGQPRHGLD